MVSFAPTAVVHELTDLPDDSRKVEGHRSANDRIRREGTRNLLAAADAAGTVRQFLAQSVAWQLSGDGAAAAEELERAVLGRGGVVLRYGFFYGPGTWYRPAGGIADQARRGEALIVGKGNAVWSFVHIDDAVAATVAALTAEPGVYNIVDDDPLSVADCLSAFARWVDAPEPRRISVDDALKVAGAEAICFHTGLTGAANSRAKAQLGFRPRRLPWKPHLR